MFQSNEFGELLDNLQEMIAEIRKPFWEMIADKVEATEDVITSVRITNPKSYGCTPGCDAVDGVVVQVINPRIDMEDDVPEDTIKQRERAVLLFACSEHMHDITMVPLELDAARNLVNALSAAIANVDARFPK